MRVLFKVFVIVTPRTHGHGMHFRCRCRVLSEVYSMCSEGSVFDEEEEELPVDPDMALKIASGEQAASSSKISFAQLPGKQSSGNCRRRATDLRLRAFWRSQTIYCKDGCGLPWQMLGCELPGAPDAGLGACMR